MEIPTYPKVVKKPMDLATIRRKLENQEYTTAQKFYDDFKLMICNCFLFNPAGTPVNLAGIELQQLFNEKWKHLPPLHEASEEEEEAEEEAEEEEHQRTWPSTLFITATLCHTLADSVRRRNFA
jgi:Bromodomain